MKNYRTENNFFYLLVLFYFIFFEIMGCGVWRRLILTFFFLNLSFIKKIVGKWRDELRMVTICSVCCKGRIHFCFLFF